MPAARAFFGVQSMKRRISTALFWFILGFTFIAGPYLPYWVTGIAVVAIAVITATGGVKQSKSNNPQPEETRKMADKFGYKVFIPVLCLAGFAVLAASFLPFGASNAIGISAVAALVVLFFVTKAPAKATISDGTRLMDNVGPIGILPQLLAALGALFTAAGVGDVIAKGVSAIIPQGSRFIAVAVYCIGMALFTAIMYEAFLQQDLPQDVQDVFTALRDASQNHLAAFERNLDRQQGTAAGGGYRGRQISQQ